MTSNIPPWIGWTLVFALIAMPGLAFTNWVEHALNWSQLWQDALLKLPMFFLASVVSSRLFPTAFHREQR